MSEVALEQIIKKSEQIIIEAGSIIEASWKTNFVSYAKDGTDIVTDIDYKVEKYIRESLTKLTPQFGFVVEEGVSDVDHEYNWSIDPIDGTKYFAKKVPMFYTQISLLKGNSPIFALTYQPISHQLFMARKHYGAYLNGTRLSIPLDNVALANAIIDIDSGDMCYDKHSWKKWVVGAIAANCYRLRMSGGYLGPALATGAIHAYVNTDLNKPPSIKNIVDLAPHQLLVEEAGYTVKVLDQFPQAIMIWASLPIIKAIEGLLTQSSTN